MSKSNKKSFVYTLKTKEGKVLLQEVVEFGSDENPFPEDWRNNTSAMMAVLDYKTEGLIERNFDITVEEGDHLTFSSENNTKKFTNEQVVALFQKLENLRSDYYPEDAGQISLDYFLKEEGLI
jgi:hypothetical protein